MSVLFCTLFTLTGCTSLGTSLAADNGTVNHQTVRIGNQSAGDNSLVAKPKLLPARAMINAPIIAQNPELPYGCEVTSLAMLLANVGHPVDKVTLAKEEPVDPTQLIKAPDGSVERWGDPNRGFVGYPDRSPGYSINHGPMIKLLNSILPGRGIDLSQHPFNDILATVSNGTPVVLWTTYTFNPTNNWVTWNSPDGSVRATFDEHAVLLVGYDSKYLYINNPLTGVKQQAIPKGPFIKAWEQLGEQAITVGKVVD